jgi:glycine/D-amino acid oxidase-like deaminating enzyme
MHNCAAYYVGGDLMESLWSATAAFPRREPLAEDMHTDVLIIGGGIAGILCAWQLHQAGISYVLAEADTVCSGITENTTAKITAQHGLLYSKLIRRLGTETAKKYLQANEAAMGEYRKLCKSIDCGFETKDACVYSLDNKKKIEEECAALERLGCPAQWRSALPLPFPVAGAVLFPRQAQFHPLKFLSAISKDLHIYEHTRVLEVRGRRALTDHGNITAEKIIVATHFPFLNKRGSYFLKQYQHRSYVLALENAPDVDGMYVDEAQKGLSFRNAEGLLLIGGGDHRTGKQGGNWAELKRFAARYYPQAKERYRWATQDCMTLDGVPYIGPYSKHTPDLYVATGFNKWGITSAMAASLLLKDQVTGRENPYSDVFSPSRTMLRPQLAVNAAEAVISLLTPTARRCPHLGCALKWNAQERSWDCPCHGSRFESDGRLIDNPATGDLPRKP